MSYEDDCNLRVLIHEDEVDHIFSEDNLLMKMNCKWAMLSVRFGYQMASIMMLRCYRKEVSKGFHFFKDKNIF